MSSIRKRFLAILLATMLVCAAFAGTSVSAASTGKQITVIPNTDEQPFIRQFLPKSLFGSGGPFTIHVQVKIEDFKKTKIDGKVFANIWDGRVESESVVRLAAYTKNTDWIDVTLTDVCEQYNAGMKAGDPITFENVKGIWLNGKLQDYILFDMGMLWSTGKATFRNFEVTNAAGEVVYSWATEEDLQGVENVMDIENPQTLIMKGSFGDSSGQLLVSDSTEDVPSVPTTEPPAYEDPQPGDSPTDAPSDATDAPTGGGDSTTSPVSEDPVATTDPSTDVTGDDTSDVDSDPSSKDSSADSSAAAVVGEPEEDGGSFPIWIPIVIVVGVIVVAGVVLLVLWKLKKLPWVKE